MPGRKAALCGLCACVRGAKQPEEDERGASGRELPRQAPERVAAGANSAPNCDKRGVLSAPQDTNLSHSLPILPILSPRPDSEGDDVLSDLPNQRRTQPKAPTQQPQAPTTALATSRRGSLYIFRHSDEVIVTPFAQVLHTLRSVHDSVKALTGADPHPAANHRDGSAAKPAAAAAAAVSEVDESDYSALADKTLKDLEWCLEQLETIQTHRSVADMASSKFKKLLDMELERMSSVPSNAANQIESYIKTTFLEKDEDTADPSRSAREANGAQSTMTKVPVKPQRPIGDAPPPPSLGVETPHASELLELFSSGLDQWGFDIFQVDALSCHHPLTAVTFAIFEKRDFFSKFRIHPGTLVNYFSQVENHYKPENPYHNAVHAADVTQSIHVLLTAPSLSSVFSDLDVFASLFACAIHDVNHPGVTNQFLINTENELAIMYNDMSVLENHHCAVAFKLLQDPASNILKELDDIQRKQLRKMVIDMVLATDMSKHMSLLADLKTMVETKKVAGGCLLKLDNYSEKMQIMQNMVHCADLSNPAKPLQLATQWVQRLMGEFFSQGDREKALGLPVSPMCCRESANVEKSQVSFIDFIMHPLWEAWTELVHPDAEQILNTLEQNRDYYCDLLATKEQQQQQEEEEEDEDEEKKEEQQLDEGAKNDGEENSGQQS